MSDATRTTVGWIMAGYAGLAALAALYALYQGNVVRVNSEFSGLPLLLLAMPWAVVLRGIRPAVFASAFNNSVLMGVVGVAINLAILALLRSRIARGGRS